ncbi:sensor histidine kinase [Hansschlegelia zhihuaiae]|uniref:histidine kinase n=1 Tax=Hansschlegelia zhihuaiae TaxID=405005 RepID=A0A4V1KJN5_9HYPH|nr:HAMP domain-containing sensor histidine kinase [Hansschlegelia zhihuaiae]RXF74812.1 HAMP domain-containing histidine kinase [Hansschlegelia zhihuaiae]
MWRHSLRSLRFRLAVLVAAVVLTTGAAAAALVWTLALADDHVSELSSAQRRLEDLSAISSRVGDYALAALQTTQSRELQTDRLSLPRKRVQETMARFSQNVAGEVSRRGERDGAIIAASRGRMLAHMKASFDVLDRQVMQLIRDAREGQPQAADSVRIALDMFAGSFGPSLSQAIEGERVAARDAEAAMAQLRARLAPIATLAVVAAALLAFLLYRAVASPLLLRLSEVAAAAADIARGRTDIRLAVRGHDELSLLTTRFNRMALHLSRREARLLSAQSRLQEIVDARTAELRRANERLSDTDRARRRFFTDVSHELRTPLTVILGEADVTLRGKPDREDLAAALATIRVRARRLHRRVEDLLRVARSENGQLDLEFEPMSLAEIASQAREGVAPAAKARQIEIVADALADEMVEADAEWMRQVVEGLISNAVRHSSPGSEIRLSVASGPQGATLSVDDDGEGIPAADLPHVFERFYRGGGEKEGSGFGIGLALARWIVERHGGRIAIDSRTAAPGRRSGTTVSIILPSLTPRVAIGAGS